MKCLLLIPLLTVIIKVNAQHPLANNKVLLDKNLGKWLKSPKKCTISDFVLDTTTMYIAELVDSTKLTASIKYNYASYLFYSPSKVLVVDIMSGICGIRKVKGKDIEENCDDGGNIYLWNTQNNKQYKIGYGSLYERYETAYWISNDVFVLGYTGYSEEDGNNTKYLNAFDLKNKMIYSYSQRKSK
jgi:hypothetical protein